jgi:hypothetical protein
VLIGGVVQDHVEDDLHTPPVDFLDEFHRVVQAAVFGSDAAVVGDVVSEIALRARVVGREPDGFKAQVLDVVEFGDDARQIADAVAVGVGKRPRADLVDGRLAPPFAAFIQNVLRAFPANSLAMGMFRSADRGCAPALGIRSRILRTLPTQ